MTAVVIDASIALSWCFDDEASPETEMLLERVRDYGATVPPLWHIELGNILLQAEKRGRIAMSDVGIRLDLLAVLPIITDQEMTARLWRDILAIARAEGLTTHDATYLELALRRELPLLTRDKELASAGKRRGIQIYP